MSRNNETILTNISSPNSAIVIVNFVSDRIISQLPLIFTIIGLIGFLGDAFTFLQPTLRSNSCCIYTLCGSTVDIINLFVNLFPNYFMPQNKNLATWILNILFCRLKLFVLVFLPQLSMNLLIMSLIDRYACSCGPTSFMRFIRQPKMIPWLVLVTIIISCVVSLYPPILYSVVPGIGCISTQPVLNSVLYIGIHGLLTPIIILLLVLLTYRKVQSSRQRVGLATQNQTNYSRNKFIGMVFAQAFVTCFFSLQWICVYIYFVTTLYNDKSAERRAVDSFVIYLTNNLYYIINVRSFYLCTLTSRLFRNTLKTALLRLLPVLHYRTHTEGQRQVSNTNTKQSRQRETMKCEK